MSYCFKDHRRMPINDIGESRILILQLLKDNIRIRTIPQRNYNLKGLLFNGGTLIVIVIIMKTLPKIPIFTILPQYLLHNMTDDQTCGRIRITIKKQDFIMRLLLDLFG